MTLSRALFLPRFPGDFAPGLAVVGVGTCMPHRSKAKNVQTKGKNIYSNNVQERHPNTHGLDTGLQPLQGVEGYPVLQGEQQLLDGPGVWMGRGSQGKFP